jgi:hypothetical protein
MRAMIRLAILVSCVAALSCGTERSTLGVVTGPPGAPGGTPTRDAALIGSWWRIVLFSDGDGTTHASETTWRFDPGGAATRTVVASNLTFGFFDTVVAGARWRTEGGDVVITYSAPDSGTVRFAYRVSGDTLTLDTRAFVRVP